MATAEDPTLTAERFIEKLMTFQSDEEKRKYHRYFKFDDDESGDGDRFVGIRMGQVFAVAKEFIDLTPNEIEKLLESPVHEIRAGGCSVMGQQASHKRATALQKRALYDLYLRRHDRINDWDLVDLAAHKVVGRYLYETSESRAVLDQLAQSENPWERRTAAVATLFLIARHESADAYRIAERLINDPFDLVNKAVGWILREASKIDPATLQSLLARHASTMPRITLRTALEHFPPKERKHWLSHHELKKA